ncbi:hypothetical protein [Frigoribacterium sp. CFBP 13712]|uniref:hypothetical protein n=1 Tax=Frigoribacterium sp. CFBP 13712 TaxID=2775309 RepID=UPI00177AFCDA|nr:hypothetical protein [Frigoribacterium sp. CFBP 13712]MBD8704983.1 hypothetical protein [Frigoribacterium sp. CFBP 13712]
MVTTGAPPIDTSDGAALAESHQVSTPSIVASSPSTSTQRLVCETTPPSLSRAVIAVGQPRSLQAYSVNEPSVSIRRIRRPRPSCTYSTEATTTVSRASVVDPIRASSERS